MKWKGRAATFNNLSPPPRLHNPGFFHENPLQKTTSGRPSRSAPAIPPFPAIARSNNGKARRPSIPPARHSPPLPGRTTQSTTRINPASSPFPGIPGSDNGKARRAIKERQGATRSEQLERYPARSRPRAPALASPRPRAHRASCPPCSPCPARESSPFLPRDRCPICDTD
jgi:hypothetical protein